MADEAIEQILNLFGGSKQEEQEEPQQKEPEEPQQKQEKQEEPQSEPEPEPESEPEPGETAKTIVATKELIEQLGLEDVEEGQEIELVTHTSEKEEPESEPESSVYDELNRLSSTEDSRSKIEREEQKEVSTPTITLTEDEFNEITTSPQKFAEFLNKVINDTAAYAVQASTSLVIPTVRNLVPTMIELRDKIQNFYKANPELQPVKSYVAHVFNELHTQNPDKPIGEVLKMTESEVRKRLGIKKSNVQRPQQRQSTSLPPTQSSTVRTGGEQKKPKDPQQEEIEGIIQHVMEGGL